MFHFILSFLARSNYNYLEAPQIPWHPDEKLSTSEPSWNLLQEGLNIALGAYLSRESPLATEFTPESNEWHTVSRSTRVSRFFSAVVKSVIRINEYAPSWCLLLATVLNVNLKGSFSGNFSTNFQTGPLTTVALQRLLPNQNFDSVEPWPRTLNWPGFCDKWKR